MLPGPFFVPGLLRGLEKLVEAFDSRFGGQHAGSAGSGADVLHPGDVFLGDEIILAEIGNVGAKNWEIHGAHVLQAVQKT